MTQVIAREHFTSKWAFKEIVRKFSNQHKWAQAPVLDQWSKVVRHGGLAPSGRPHSTGKTSFDDFMFDPVKFSCDEFTRLRALCEQSVPVAGPNYVRDGIDDEWAVIVGLVEGTIACRRLTEHVFKSEERLRLLVPSRLRSKGN